MTKASEIVDFIRRLYGIYADPIPLHAPVFIGDEKRYLEDCIDSTFVSTVGNYVNRLEEMICDLTGAKFSVATVNGTSALHAALLSIGVQGGDEVLTQPLSFVATANAISYCGAKPVFLDVDQETLGLSHQAVEIFLQQETVLKEGACYNRTTGARIAACVPMHTFGHPCALEPLLDLCIKYSIPIIEDAAEALGSYRSGKHCGTFGAAGIISFNGNKIVTSGGGGVIVTDDVLLAERIRFLTTTAKKDHPWAYEHTEIGYNYRMPNINAALGCAQLQELDGFLKKKRTINRKYNDFFSGTEFQFIAEPPHCRSNYWLNAILAPDRKERDVLLTRCNEAAIMVRPAWGLLNRLPMYRHCQCDSLATAAFLEDRLVNLPSGVGA